MSSRPEEARMLQLLDEICLDSLEGLASEQEPRRGHISSLFHELRGLMLAQGRVIEAADDLLRRLSEWDMLYVSPEGKPITGDGPYWQAEIARTRAALAAGGEGETP